MSNSGHNNFSTGTAILLHDLSKLLSSNQKCDIQFKIGEPTAPVTLYAHSNILCCRSPYFEAMLGNNNDYEWKESSTRVIHKPNISPDVFQKVLEYIYTGNVQSQQDNFIELISAAEEMELKDLSIQCQLNVIKALDQAFLNKKVEYIDGIESIHRCLPSGVDLHEFLFPTLIFVHNYPLFDDFFQQLIIFTASHIDDILGSQTARTAFFEQIPIHIFEEILASDQLSMQEYEIWELAFSFACHMAKVKESMVEEYFKNNNIEYGTEVKHSKDEISCDNSFENGLKQLKANLATLLPKIRFNNLKSYQFSRIFEILMNVLPLQRFTELAKYHYHAQTDERSPLDLPRGRADLISKIINKEELWYDIKTWIFEAFRNRNYRLAGDIEFNLLFRASEHEFLAGSFHGHCDNKGPTIVIAESNDGHLFGGVNFIEWSSNYNCPIRSSSIGTNFLFSLDGYHQKCFTFIGNKNQATHNKHDCGPVFGGMKYSHDLFIANKANISSSSSFLPNSYNGLGACNTSLAGNQHFFIKEYEVFSFLSNY